MREAGTGRGRGCRASDCRTGSRGRAGTAAAVPPPRRLEQLTHIPPQPDRPAPCRRSLPQQLGRGRTALTSGFRPVPAAGHGAGVRRPRGRPRGPHAGSQLPLSRDADTGGRRIVRAFPFVQRDDRAAERVPLDDHRDHDGAPQCDDQTRPGRRSGRRRTTATSSDGPRSTRPVRPARHRPSRRRPAGPWRTPDPPAPPGHPPRPGADSGGTSGPAGHPRRARHGCDARQVVGGAAFVVAAPDGV